MTYDDFIAQALETILDLDLPDEACSDAVSSRAAMLAGVEPEDLPG